MKQPHLQKYPSQPTQQQQMDEEDKNHHIELPSTLFHPNSTETSLVKSIFLLVGALSKPQLQWLKKELIKL